MMTLDELFSIYCEKRLKLGSKNTHRLYKHSLKSFEKTLCRKATVADLTDDNLERHMARVVSDGRSKATANKDRHQITAIWRFANRNGYVTTWPNVRAIQEPERVPLGWLPQEIDQIFDSIEREPGTVAGAPAKLWWSCLIRVLLDTGERIGPMRQLARTALTGEYLLIPAEFRKRGTRDKLYKLSPETVTQLRELLRSHPHDKLFPWHRSETYIYHCYTRILKRARLSHGDKNKFHAIRRSVASAVKRLGGDATAALDHSSPRTTMRYFDPRIVDNTPTSDFMRRYREGG